MRSVGVCAGGPLHLAADSDSEELVAALLDRGALVNATNAVGDTPLHIAAKRGSVAVLTVLLSDPAVRHDLPNAEGKARASRPSSSSTTSASTTSPPPPSPPPP